MRVAAIIAVILFVLAIIGAAAILLGAPLEQGTMVVLALIAAGLAVRELPG